MKQLDIYGQPAEPKPEPPSDQVKQPKVDQPRLFEPQMEGQLDLLTTDG